MNGRADITILGGGISGVTTGVVLQLLGHRTRIYTAARLDAPGSNPAVASHWAAASVIPHSVEINGVERHMRRAQLFFEALRRAGECSVRLQRHYEVFETPTPQPPYADAMQGFRRILESDGGVPRRREAEAVYGWHFDAYFADLSVYRPCLCALYEAAGGRIVQRRLMWEDLTEVPGDVLVNCTGLGTLGLFGDAAPMQVLRGRLVHAEGAPPLTLSKTGEPFSYNYVPGPEVYRMPDGTPGDVYAYPRADGVVLGGTRESGRLAADGSWQPEAAYDEPTRRLDGCDVPAPLFCLNRRLVLDLTGVDLEAYPKRVLTGYRFVRDPVRLEVSEEEGRPVVHNYGHGGAGVALSWSCASEVARLLGKVGRRPLRSTAEAELCTRLRHLAEQASA